MLPVGFLLTMYTQTGYDASAHTAEETRGAAKAAAQGVWRSVFFSALIGWFVLLAFLFAATHVARQRRWPRLRRSAIFTSALDPWAAKLVILIATVGQFFCGAAGLTSASRTWYAFSRDRGMPGWALFRRVNRDRVPFNAVIAVSVFSLVIAIPALFGKNDYPVRVLRAHRDLHRRPLPRVHHARVPAAAGRATRSRPGPWNLGDATSSSTCLAIIFVVVVVSRARPAVHARPACPGTTASTSSVVNYTPLAILLPLIFGVWYLVSAKNKYQGPVRTLEEDEVTAD